jgi:N-acetylmuramic acid 6-phosphate etherase
LTKKAKKRSSGKAPRGRKVFDELLGLVTEETNPASAKIDRMSTRGILRVINNQDSLVAKAVAREIPYIARAVDMAVKAFRGKGRLFYLGAGTSGRLGVLDAAECPPTFGTDPGMIQGIIAGGHRSLIRSKEGAEDDTTAALNDIKEYGVKRGDLVVGITASRRTPYVLNGLREAKRKGAGTVFICCNPRKDAPGEFDLNICPVVGPEVVAGSSRMKAGTAQKMILNMITTAAMIKIGKVYGNRMIDLKASSEKLKERSKRVLMDICGIEYEEAREVLKRAGGSVKTAIVMVETGLSRKESESRLRSSGGFVHKATNKN